jgi:hypothetical protein
MPVFPLKGAILLPRVTLPLNIFEPRYLAMVDHALSTTRVIGILQPKAADELGESPTGKGFGLRAIGTAGRITSYSETADGRYLITLTGVARFDVAGEVESQYPFRICDVRCDRFAYDLVAGWGEDEVDRERLLKVLRSYLEQNNLKADWEAINRSSTEFLVNTLSMISPYGAEEKQALLEAAHLKERSEVLVALAEMQLASRSDGSGSAIQ